MSIDDIFQKCVKYYGEKYGDVFDILRPNYGQVDNTPSIIHSGVKLRLDPNTSIFSEPKLREVDWYEIFGDRSLLKSGDIIRKTVADDGMTPEVTFGHR